MQSQPDNRPKHCDRSRGNPGGALSTGGFDDNIGAVSIEHSGNFSHGLVVRHLV